MPPLTQRFDDDRACRFRQARKLIERLFCLLDVAADGEPDEDGALELEVLQFGR